MIAITLLAQDHSAPFEVDIGLSGILKLAGPDCLFENTLHDTFLDFVDKVSQKQSTVIEAKIKKPHSTSRRNNKAWSRQARHLWTNLALPCVAGTQSFEKPYKNRLMQNQAMEITAGRAMRHRTILGDFASPDSQVAMETSIIGCRIARFCFSVTGLLAVRPYLSYNFSCASYKYCRICSIFEISGFLGTSNVFLLLHNFG